MPILHILPALLRMPVPGERPDYCVKCYGAGKNLHRFLLEESNMNEKRALTADEHSALSAVLTQLGTPAASVERFIDTHFEKTYDVYLLDGKTVLKKCDAECRDQVQYDRYFAGHDFAVPKILDHVTVGAESYILMEYIQGSDARACSAQDAGRVGTELARIQSYYLMPGGHTKAADHYFTKYVSVFCGKLMNDFADLAPAVPIVEQRFFEAPHSLVHDDLLPINVILGEQKPWIIDWATAGMFPYFLDLARFAFVESNKCGFLISEISARTFLEAYYEEMRKNADFKIGKQQFYMDVAISAFCQYAMFVYYEEDTEHIQSTKDYQYLKKIVEHLIGTQAE